MSRIRSRNTTPELLVRSLLHRMGYRFSLRRPDLPGKPDIVLPGRRTVVFVHGCFWHRHRNCPNATTPKTRRPFWLEKFDRNVARDAKARQSLTRLGWKTVIVWECEVMRDPHRVAERLNHRLKPKTSKAHKLKLPARTALIKKAERRADYNARHR